MADHHRSMVNHLRDMFNGSFEEDLIEFVLIQREWNVDRALDDLMTLTGDCTFNIPIEDFDSQSNETAFGETNSDDTLQREYVDGMQNAEVGTFDGADAQDVKHESDDGIIVLDEEEYCMSVESESDEDSRVESEACVHPAQSPQPSENNPPAPLSYSSVAKKLPPPPKENEVRSKLPPIMYSGYTSYDRIKRTRDSLERVKLYVQGGFKIMVILRGCPGSGKSYLAKSIFDGCGIEDNYYYYVHSTDNYFYLNKSGTYQFDREKLSEAHGWNVANVLHVVREGLTPIVVDNTNTQMWEMRAYATMAVCAGYEIEVMEPDTSWSFNASLLAKKNQHGVPKDKIMQMLEHYECNVSALGLLKNFGLEYAGDKAPPRVGTRELTNETLKSVFDNLRNVMNFVPAQKPSKPKRQKAKKLTKAEKKKQKKLEKKLKKMAKLVRREDEDDESENEEEPDDEYADSEDDENDASDNSLKKCVMNNILESFVATNLEEDTNSDLSWSTAENSEDDSNAEPTSSDDDEDGDYCESSSSDELDEKADEKDDVRVPAAACAASDEAEDLMQFSDDEATKEEDERAKNSFALAADGSLHSVNTMVGRLKNPMNLGKDASSVHTRESTQHKFSNQLYDALAKTGPRLQCFAQMRDENEQSAEGFEYEQTSSRGSDAREKDVEGGPSPSATSEVNVFRSKTKNDEHALNNVLSSSDTEQGHIYASSALSDRASSPAECSINEVVSVSQSQEESAPEWKCQPANESTSDVLRNLCYSPRSDVGRPVDAESKRSLDGGWSDELDQHSAGLDRARKPEDAIPSAKIVNSIATTETNADDMNLELSTVIPSCLLNDLISPASSQPCDEEKGDKFNVVVSTPKKNRTPEKEVNLNSEGILKVDASKSYNPAQSKRTKLCNVVSQQCNEADLLQTFLAQDIYKSNRHENDVNVDDVQSSNKFDRGFRSADISNSLIKNVIENKLWGENFEEDVNVFECKNRAGKSNQSRVLDVNTAAAAAVRLEENSENSDYGSHSSSSEEVRIEDVHNSVNRFVNNDINSEPGVERKKANVDREKCFRNRYSSDDESSNENLCWSVEAAQPELNTLKERILINSLDKVFNLSPRNTDAEAAVAEADAESREPKKCNLPGRNSSSAFHMIENQLRDKNNAEAATGERNDFKADEYVNVAARSEHAVEEIADKADSKFWNQWMCGDDWDDGPKELESAKRDRVDAKPPRKSPSKQKNSETANIRLVNDIKNVSDGCKAKNKNVDCVQRLPKSSNFQSANELMQQYAWEHRDYSDDYPPIGSPAKRVNRSASHSLNTVSKNYAYDPEAERKCKSFDSVENGDLAFPAAGSPAKTFDWAEGRTENVDNVWTYNEGVGRTSKAANDDVSAYDVKTFRHSAKKKNADDKITEGLVENFLQKLKIISKDENTASDLERNDWKWSAVNENADPCWPTEGGKLRSSEQKSKLDSGGGGGGGGFESSNFFIPAEVLNLGRNKATNTGTDDLTGCVGFLTGRSREINDGRSNDHSPVIEARYKCHKSTMTEGNSYTVKAKPLREDLSNMFPSEMADVILDLYDKCQGNMDWIIEILMEDGYSPSDDQLEYLSSLQNVVECNTPNGSAVEKDKPLFEKKKGKCRNSKNGRKSENKNQFPPARKFELKCSEMDSREDGIKNISAEIDSYGENLGDDKFDDSTESVELFLDRTTVSQLEKYFGNPTVYPIKDYQPVIKLPVSLAQQIHAYLIENVIDQAEKNEYLINQLHEEEENLAGHAQNKNAIPEFTQNDVIDVENSLSDILLDCYNIASKYETPEGTDQCTRDEVKPIRNEDSFASKLSLNLLLKGFPTIDTTFVINTFKSQNFNYYDTKQFLSQYGTEVPITNAEENANTVENNLLEEDVPLFDDFPSTAISRNEVIEKVQHFRHEAAFNYGQWQICNEKLKTALQQKKFGVAAYYREVMNAFKKKYEYCNAQAAAVLVTSCCFQNEDIIDLHFFKVIEALKALDMFLDHHINRLLSSGRGKCMLYIITGRGIRSVGGISHLQPPIKERLKRRNIAFAVDSTNTGLVKAIIRKNSLLSRDL